MTMASDSRIQPLYDFVRSALNESAKEKPFMLYQPPRLQFPEHPIAQPKKKGAPYKANAPIAPANYGPVRGASTSTSGTGGKETLFELGLVPQSMLLVRFEEDEMNGGYITNAEL
jgi:tether containing UBX domain for GLUT4